MIQATVNLTLLGLLHQKRNDHHWQWWILLKDDGTIKVFPMSKDAIHEMICDWKGAGLAQGAKNDPNDYYKETKDWYKANKSKMTFHKMTQESIEHIIEYF